MAIRPECRSAGESDRIRHHLQEILASDEFAGSPKLSRFLEFTVELTVAGEGDELKEYRLGVEIYGRDPKYDPRTDPIVRVEARRLRAKLRQFYEARTPACELEFEYPKGTYAPEFRFRDCSQGAASTTRRRSPRRAALLIGSAVSLLSLSAVLVISRGHVSGSLRDPELTRVTADPGLSAFPVLSFDGQRVAYASDRDAPGELHIWVQPVQPVGRGEAKRLTYEPATNTDSSFSADGRLIAYRSDRGAEGGIYVVPSSGGSERLLVPNGLRPRFSPDGKWLAYWIHRNQSASGKDELYVLALAGGSPHRIAPDFASATLPNWSSDGKRLLFRGMSGVQTTLNWYVADLEGGAPIFTDSHAVLGKYRLVHALPWDYKPYAWVDDRVLFTARQGEITDVWQLHLSKDTFKASGIAERLTTGTGFNQFPAMVKPPHQNPILAFAETSANINVWSLPIQPGTGKVIGEPQPVTSELATWLEYPSVSIDRSKLTHTFVRSRETNLTFIRDLRTGSLSKLDRNPISYDYATISPDGSLVAYRNVKRMPDDYCTDTYCGPYADPIYVVPTDSRQHEAHPTLVCADCGLPMSWSPDNRKLLFSPRREPASIAVLDVQSGRHTELFSDPTSDLEAARFSPSGEWIAFSARTRSSPAGVGRIYLSRFDAAADKGSRSWIGVTDSSGKDVLPAWSPEGNLLYLLSWRDGFRCIWAQRLDPGSKRPIGAAFPIRHFHEFRHSMRTIVGPPEAVGLGVTRDRLFFSLDDVVGNVWVARW